MGKNQGRDGRPVFPGPTLLPDLLSLGFASSFSLCDIVAKDALMKKHANLELKHVNAQSCVFCMWTCVWCPETHLLSTWHHPVEINGSTYLCQPES